MPSDDLQLVPQIVEAWNAGDIDGLMELVADDAVLETDPRFLEGGTFLGKAEIRRFFEGVREGWEAGSLLELVELDEAGDQLLAAFRWRGTGETSGVEATLDVFALLRSEDGKLTSVRYFFERAEAEEIVSARSQS